MSRQVAAPTNNDDDDGQRWHIPPPVLGLTGFTGPEGVAILEEVEGTLGPLLWSTFRRVATWSATPGDVRRRSGPRDGRPGAIRESDASRIPAELTGPLEILASIHRAVPADDRALGGALQAVGRWATAVGHVRTGVEYHQLAANVCPRDAEIALAAGQVTRRLADYSRSEIWIQRAVGLARRERDWRIYTECFIELGTMMRRRGNVPAARRHFQRAYRRAVRAGLRDLRAQAAHDLFVIDTELADRESAVRWAMEALRTYPRGDGNIPRVAFDLAFLWLADGLHEPALRVFTMVEPLIHGPGNAVVWGGIGRAAGGCGSHEHFARARAELLRAAPSAGLSDAWLELARGARLLGRPEDAAAAAGTSLELARSRGERKVEIQAEEFLSQLDIVESGEAPPEPSGAGRWSEAIADEVIQALQAT